MFRSSFSHLRSPICLYSVVVVVFILFRSLIQFRNIEWIESKLNKNFSVHSVQIKTQSPFDLTFGPTFLHECKLFWANHFSLDLAWWSWCSGVAWSVFIFETLKSIWLHGRNDSGMIKCTRGHSTQYKPENILSFLLYNKYGGEDIVPSWSQIRIPRVNNSLVFFSSYSYSIEHIPLTEM